MKLNIVGAGVVGKTLSKIWLDYHLIELGGVWNRTETSSKKAVDGIGAGEVIGELKDFSTADLWMISVSDDALKEVIEKLKVIDFSSAVVFHCSGATSSTILKPLGAKGVASIHPIKSFVDRQVTKDNFKGTFFTIEGESVAVKEITPLVSAIGAIAIEIKSDNKLVYHSAMVMVSNYLAALIFSAEELLVKSGIPKELALKMISPLVDESLKNCLNIGPVQALTGPVQRGDLGVVKDELAELKKLNLDFYQAYSILGKIAVTMAKERGLSQDIVTQLKDLFNRALDSKY